ncbi:hypothetical protein AX17_002762 [Amanita inopinata Kibby_2008]|nr:hypothetical protein AX17_002762 [Amanita inopinata Kibby_2008]
MPFIPSRKGAREKGGSKRSIMPSAFRPSIVNPSQQAHPFIGSSFSSSQRDIAPVLITFDDWNKGGIFDWYRKTARVSRTNICKLELRKERENFRHEFVVVYLEGGDIYRIDRRPLGGGNADTISSNGCEAEDSILFVNKKEYEAIRSNTDTEVTLGIGTGKKLDLYAVIAICVSVRMDPQAKSYTLQLYNCYFLARTIVTLMVRHFLLQTHVSRHGLQWDSVTETAISNYIFHDDWDVLDAEMKAAVTAVLVEMLWPVVKVDAEPIVEKRKQWEQLETITKDVIHDTVKDSLQNLVDDSVKTAMNEWVLEATSATLWHGDLGDNLSAARYRLAYETVTMDVLRESVKPELQRALPGNMKSRLGHMLPRPLLSRLPESLLANLPAEVLARIPIRVIEKLPDDLLHKLPVEVLLNAPEETLRQISVQFIERLPDALLEKTPTGIMLKAPDELFQKISTRVYSKLPNKVLLNPPEDLNRLPDELLEISLQCIQEVLERPGDPDRPYAVKLLQRLPDSVRERLPPEYRDIQYMVTDDQLETQLMAEGRETDECDALMLERSDAAQIATSSRSRFLLSNILRMILRIIPHPILDRIPQTLINHTPVSWLKAVPADILAQIPQRALTRVSVSGLERLPNELIDRLPESVLRRLPHATIQRLPDTLLARLPADFIKNIPPEVMENVSEELSDVVQEKLSTEVFDRPRMVEEITRGTESVVKEALLQSKGDLPNTVLRASVRLKSKGIRSPGSVLQAVETHEQLQLHILGMIRKHSRMVAQVTHLGVGEDAVYNELRMKTTSVWSVMRLHSTPPGQSG